MYSYFDSTTLVTPFGLIFITAILSAWIYARRNSSVSGIDESHIDLLMPLSVITGIAGGKAISFIIPIDHMLAGELMNHGARVRLFGLLAAGSVAVFVYSRIAKLPFRQLLDVFALPTLAGLMIHRIGCFLAGCCWGDIVTAEDAGAFAAQVQTWPFVSSLVSGVQYPLGSLPWEQHVALGLIEPDATLSLAVIPVQLYEAALLFVVLLALWRFPWRRFPPATLTVIVTCTYAALRFLIEYLRADGHLVAGNLTVTQLQCLVLLSSAVLLPRLLRSPRRFI